jgi:predicted DNA-binding protein (MmcQ/YjbR family)
VFCDVDAIHLSVKLPKEEAEAVVATDPQVEPAGYGLGRHGWVAIMLDRLLDADGWQELEEWVRSSYTLVAPKRLAGRVLKTDEPSLRGGMLT